MSLIQTICVSFVLILGTTPTRAADVDFARDVLPILSDKCFHCHGPDEQSRKGKLRLDTEEGTKKVIVKGKSSDSELYNRVVSHDENEQMPPPSANRTLTAKQKETLKAWIDSGAKWGTHWSLSPIAPPQRGGIDTLIRARLAKENLKPSPPATKEAWLRRVTLDLTGLPPSPEEIRNFQKDSSGKAFETVVDRLLASPRYGERMAADWLDIARFADTHGYQMDRYRPVWPYRDWVIDAFNKNLHYDDFVKWQLAGDLLPNPTQEQQLATAFNRLHVQNEEGGIVEEEFRVASVTDRVTTFGTAFLGLTMECCRCHDHKYDPISQKDFYSLFAFFQNIDESGQTSYFTAATPVPALLLPTPSQSEKMRQLKTTLTTKELALEQIIKAHISPAAITLPATPTPVASFPFNETIKNQTPNTINPKAPATAEGGPVLVPGKVGQAVSLNGENGFSFPGAGHFAKSDPFSFSFWIRPPKAVPRSVVLHHSRAPIDAGSRGYEILLENNRLTLGLHHMWPGNSMKVRASKALPTDEWSHVVIGYDGSGRAKGTAIYVNGLKAEQETIRDTLTKNITYDGGEPNLTLGHRFRDNGFKGGSVDELQIYNRKLTACEAALLAGVPNPKVNGEDDLEFNANYITAREELRVARKAYDDFIMPIPEIMTMRELPAPKPTYLLKRGAYDSPGELVTANTPAVLPPFPVNAPKNRLGLAQWLLAKNNPLFTRVAVNRLWQQMFGKGLVETADNFGRQGSTPTHPELLDWLADDFAHNHYDIKLTLKQIALSDTYRQSSTTNPEYQAKDPANTFLGHYPATRLSAEMLRDQALFASGLLVEKLGGPSVKPYQPDGLWDMAMGKPKYDQGKGSDLYRRSVYTFAKRTVPHPQMTTFDAADRSNCTVRRQNTSTPLQALALLNDVQIVEAARYVAERMLKQGTTPTEQVTWAFVAITSRTPTDKETKTLVAMFDEQNEMFAKTPAEAAKLLKVGEGQADGKLAAVDLAAGTTVALAIFNLDAAVMKR